MYDSALLALIYGNFVPNKESSFTVSDSLFDGMTLSDGSIVMHAYNNAIGGMTVDLGLGEGTASIRDNVYGSETITFSDSTIDPIVGRPSLFGETFAQSGSSVGSIEPSFMGDGMSVIMDSGPTYVGASNILSSFTFSAGSTLDINSFSSPSYLHDFSSVGSFADTTSSLDVLDAATAINGLDVLDFL